MKIVVINSVKFQGKYRDAGEVVDVPEEVAVHLISVGAAQISEEPEEPKEPKAVKLGKTGAKKLK